VNVSAGLGFNGYDDRGIARWDLIDNADIVKVEVWYFLLIFYSLIYVFFFCFLHIVINSILHLLELWAVKLLRQVMLVISGCAHCIVNSAILLFWFTHPPPLGGADAYMFYICFFVFFSSATIVHKYETTVLGNGWMDFHETFTKR